MPKDPVRAQKNKQILKDNKNKNFVKRINNPTQSILDYYGNPMTHFMESSDNIVYPRVVETQGNLKTLTPEEAYEYARQSGEYIQFPSEQDAIDYGKNYKQGTALEEFKNGGKMKKSKIKKKKSKGPVVGEFPPIAYNMGGKFYPNGGNLAGDLGNTGITNDQVSQFNPYLKSGERVLAGIASGLADVVGLGSVVQASNDAMGVSDQLSKSKEYKTAAGITGGIAGLGMNVLGMATGKGMKKSTTSTDQFTPPTQDVTMVDPNTNPTEYSTQQLNPGGQEVDLVDNGYNIWNNAMGGKLNFSSAGNYHKWLGYIHATGLAESTSGSQKVSIKGKPHNVKHPDGGSLIPTTTKYDRNPYLVDYNKALNSQPVNTTTGLGVAEKQPLKNYLNNYLGQPQVAKTMVNYPVNNKVNLPFAQGGWIPPQDQLIADQPNLVADAQLTYGNDWYGKLQQIDAQNPIFDQSTYDPNNLYTKNQAKRFEGYMLDTRTNPMLPWKTYDNPLSSEEGMLEGQKTKVKRNTNQVQGMENTYSKKQKFGYANGGTLGLSEANGGFIHEDPNSQNVNQGVPINDQATVEVGETIFNPENYVFSDRIKVPGKKYTFADVSKKIKNKFKLRPDDKLSKDAITQDLTILMNEQEAIKQAKAQSLMMKAVELNPQLVQQIQPQQPMMGNGGSISPEQQAINKARQRVKDTEIYYSNMSNMVEQPNTQKVYGELNKVNYPVDKRTKKFPYGGGIDPETGLPNEDVALYPSRDNADEIIGISRNPTLIPNYLYGNQNLKYNPPVDNTTVSNVSTTNLVPQNVYGQPVVSQNPEIPTEEELNTRVLSNTQLPKDMIGINAGMYGLQAGAEMLRLGLTPNSPLTGNTRFDRINPYLPVAQANQVTQQTQANLKDVYRNSGVNPSQYLSGVTTGLGNINAQAGLNNASILQQGLTTNAQIQAQEAQLNKQLELQRNEIKAQDIANRSNQMGAVGAGLVQNLNTSLGDKSRRDTDLYALQFMNKDNYKMATTQKEADEYGVEIGDYFFVPSGYKKKTSKIKKKSKG